MLLDLELPTGPEAVPTARRLVAERLTGVPGSMLHDALLVVTELVANAVLHGAPPVLLTMDATAAGVRLEVRDHGAGVPASVTRPADALTGRGLSLVGAVTGEWGVRQEQQGKTVWAVLGTAPVLDVSPSGWAQEPYDAPGVRVELRDIPTALLQATMSHLDDVVRELRLTGRESVVSEGLMRLAPVWVGLRDQADDAARAGERLTHAVLELSPDAAADADQFVSAFEVLEEQARAERLLTLAAPPSLRLLVTWTGQAIGAQLRTPGLPPPSFADAMLGAVDAAQDDILAAERAAGKEAERLAGELGQMTGLLSRLQVLTTALVGARDAHSVGEIVTSSAETAFGAHTARIYLADGDELRSLSVRGGERDAVLTAAYDSFPIAAHLPGSVAYRSGKMLVVPNREELAQRFPALAGVYRNERSLLVAPLQVAGRRLGVLSLTFKAGSEVADHAQQLFLGALADACAQAVERTTAVRRATEAVDKLTFLAEASAELADVLDYRATLANIANLVVPRLADWCTVHLRERDAFELVAVAHTDEAKAGWARELSERYPVDPTATTGVPQIARSGVSEIYPEIADELLVAGARDADHLVLLREVGMNSALMVPLAGRHGVLGVLTMIHAESGRRYDEDDRALADELGRRAGVAVETAAAFRRQTGQLAAVSRIADAVQRAILPIVPARVGCVALAARYVSATADALVGGDLYEVVPRKGAVRLLIGDVRGKGMDAVRTTTVVLGEYRTAAELPDLVAAAERLDARIRPYLAEEDFVTAQLVEITDDGTLSVVSCGHPPPLLLRDGSVVELNSEPALPLGLGSRPARRDFSLRPGDRLLLHTDGLLEARTPDGQFLDPSPLVAGLAAGDLDEALERLLDQLGEALGGRLTDDLAMLLVEWTPAPRGERPSHAGA